MRILQLSESTLLTRRNIAEARRVPSVEIKRAFLLAYYTGLKFSKSGRNVSRQELEDYSRRMHATLSNENEQQINDHIIDKRRMTRYDSMEWSRGTANLSDLGPWPKMKDLDVSFTTGNVIETAQQIMTAQNGNIPQGLLSCLDSIQTHIDLIRPFFPLMLFPGGEIRNNEYNIWAIAKDESLCHQFQYDIDDGSMRAVAYALAGLEDAPVYIGKYPTQAKITPRLNGTTKRNHKSPII